MTQWLSAEIARDELGYLLTGDDVAKAGRCLSIGAASQQNDQERPADDKQILSKRPILNVIEIEIEHAFVIYFRSATDLPRAGQSGRDFEATCVCIRVRGKKPVTIAELKGTRAN